MSLTLSILTGVLIFTICIVVFAEIAMRRNGSGIAQAVYAACMPKVNIHFQVIRADGTREEIRQARTSKATFAARVKLLKISVLMRLKVSLEDLSNYLRNLGG